MTTAPGILPSIPPRLWLLPLMLTFAAAALRMFWLDHPLLWTDEVFTWVYTRETFAHHLALDRTSDLHPPLHPIMLKAWIALLGESRTTMRSLSVLFGALTLPALYLIARNWTGTRVAIIACILFAFNPISIHYSREARAYAALSFFLLWAIYFFLEIVRKRQNGSSPPGWQLAGFVICLATTFHLHYLAVLFFPLFGLAALLIAFLARDKPLFLLLACATAAAAILCIPQSLHFFGYATQGGSVRNEWILPTTWKIFVTETLGAYPFPSFTKLLMGPLYLYGAYRLWYLSRPLFVVVATFVAVATLLLAAIGFIRPLYLVRSIQCFTILSPILLGAALSPLSNRLLAPALLLVVGIHVWASSPDYPHARQSNRGEVIKAAIASREGDLVYFDANLEEELAGYRVDVGSWRPLRLMDAATDGGGIARELADCSQKTRSCPAITVIIEHEPLFEKAAGKAWSRSLDSMVQAYPVQSDQILSNYRIVTFPNLGS